MATRTFYRVASEAGVGIATPMSAGSFRGPTVGMVAVDNLQVATVTSSNRATATILRTESGAAPMEAPVVASSRPELPSDARPSRRGLQSRGAGALPVMARREPGRICERVSRYQQWLAHTPLDVSVMCDRENRSSLRRVAERAGRAGSDEHEVVADQIGFDDVGKGQRVSAGVGDHGVRRALHGMGHQIGEVGEDAASELDHVVVG